MGEFSYWYPWTTGIKVQKSYPHLVQDYLNEISPTFYGPNKPKTSGKSLRIPDLQPPASNHDKPDTL